MKINEEAIHVKVSTNEAKNMKKQLLETQTCFLNILKNLEEFKTLRKKETSEEQKARSSIKQISTEIEKIFALLPGEEKEKEKIKAKETRVKPIRIRIGKRKEKIVKIEEELEKIKEKLASLA